MRVAWLALLALSACTLTPAPELAPPTLPQRAGVDPIVAARAAGAAFQIVADDYVIDIMREDEIIVTRLSDGSRRTLPKPEPQYPRWNGEIYHTGDENTRLTIAIRDDRPCERRDRAVYPTRVDVHLNGGEIPACGVRL
jgi:hypothetical protein